MNQLTHKNASAQLCGTPLKIENGESIVELQPTQNMVVDDKGLVHGGFIFGLADYAAMIAVNHPNVVLGAADVKFLKPVSLNQKVIAHAKIDPAEPKTGKKQLVKVDVKSDETLVFTGVFTCFSLEKHVLD